MQTYLVTFHGGIAVLKYQHLDKTNEAAQNVHRRKWAAWMAGLGEKGILITGYPLDIAGRRIDASAVEDYIFPEDSAGGFIAIKTDSMEEATEILKDCPILPNGGFVLVRLCGAVK